jgi:excinuclease UvrABC nuclease subunit
MGKKTVGFNLSGLEKLPNDKPAVYKIKTDGSNTNYVGIAKRGRLQERLQEHLPGGKDYIPGSKVEIEQMHSISEARQKESNIIKKSKPRYNKQGK